MIKKNRKYVYVATIILIFCNLYCQSTPGEPDFDNKESVKGTTWDKLRAEDRIDGSRTYQVYFRLEEPDECIKIRIKSTVFKEAIQRDELLRTFFIIEKSLDLSRFKGPGKKDFVFFELARNFDSSWNRKRDVILCTVEGDPIKKLDNHLFRIRFTTFRKKEFNFEITIFSESDLKIFKHLPAK